MKLNLYKIIFVFCSLSFSSILPNTQNLVILLEFGENEGAGNSLNQSLIEQREQSPEGLGAASNLLLNALYQNVSLLVPAPLWDNITDHKAIFDDFVNKKLSFLKERYKKYKRFNTNNDLIKFQNGCLLINQIYQKVLTQFSLSKNLENLKEDFYKELKELSKKYCIDLEDPFLFEEIGRYLMCSVVPLEKYLIKKIIIKDLVFFLFIPKILVKENEKNLVKSLVKEGEKIISKNLKQENNSNFKNLVKKDGTNSNLIEHENFSELELSLGLKIKNMKDIELESLLKEEYVFKKDYPKISLELIKSIFILNNEIPEELQTNWTIYIMGHGCFCPDSKEKLLEIKKDKNSRYSKKYMQEIEKSNRILGFSVEKFKELVKFFNTKINTNLLFYSSCSAGGERLIECFRDENGKTIKTKFPIIMDTLAEAPSLCVLSSLNLINLIKDKKSWNKIIDLEKRCIKIDTPYNFSELFQGTKNSCSKINNNNNNNNKYLTKNYTLSTTETATQKGSQELKQKFCFNLFESMSSNKLSCTAQDFLCRKRSKNKKPIIRNQLTDINNIISVRPANSEQFNIINQTESFLYINEKFLNNIKTDELNLNNNIEVIFLGKSDIPIKFKVEGKEFPLFVSLIPGKASHKIQEIYAPNICFSEIINRLLTIIKLAVPKLISIEKITCLNDVSPGNDFNKQKTFKNVLVFNAINHPNKLKYRFSQKYNGFIFSDENCNFQSLWEYNREQLTKNLTEQNNKQISLIKEYFNDANKYEKDLDKYQNVASLEEISKQIRI